MSKEQCSPGDLSIFPELSSPCMATRGIHATQTGAPDAFIFLDNILAPCSRSWVYKIVVAASGEARVINLRLPSGGLPFNSAEVGARERDPSRQVYASVRRSQSSERETAILGPALFSVSVTALALALYFWADPISCKVRSSKLSDLFFVLVGHLPLQTPRTQITWVL